MNRLFISAIAVSLVLNVSLPAAAADEVSGAVNIGTSYTTGTDRGGSPDGTLGTDRGGRPEAGGEDHDDMLSAFIESMLNRFNSMANGS